MKVYDTTTALQTMRRWKREKTTVLTKDDGTPYRDSNGDPVTVQGHCAGAVGRAFLKLPAGYPSAHAMLAAAKARGKLRTTRPPKGAVLLYEGGKYGHTTAKAAPGRGMWGVDLHRGKYTPGYVGRTSIRTPERLWGYKLAGWCWAADLW